MKKITKEKKPISLWIAIFTLTSVVVIGGACLSLERSQQSLIFNKIYKLNKEMDYLLRENLELSSRIAKLESPDSLKMRLGTLSPISENMLVQQSYDEVENGHSVVSNNIALEYNSTVKIGVANTHR